MTDLIPTIHPKAHYGAAAGKLDEMFRLATDADRAAEAASWASPHLNAVAGKLWRRYETAKDDARAEVELAAEERRRQLDVAIVRFAETPVAEDPFAEINRVLLGSEQGYGG